MALSTAEAEYVTLSNPSQESVWMRRLNPKLDTPLEGPTTILEGNQQAIAMAKNSQFHRRAEHIDI